MNGYERDPYSTEIGVTVVDSGSDEHGAYVVLDDTVLYPEGGGQPADRGWIDETSIVDVLRTGGEIRHYVDGEVAAGSARLRLDWERRYDHMQQHTAQHVITAIAADEFGWPTTSFHLGKRSSDIELDTEGLGGGDLELLERRVAAVVRADLPVSSRRVEPSQLEALQVRTRGLPEGHQGNVRLVQIEGIDLNTCGGTHVASTAEIEAVKLLSTEPMRGGTRLYWIAGGRVRARLAEHEQRAAELRRVFEAADDEIVDLAAAKLGRLKEAERRLARLQGQLADQMVSRLEESPEVFIEAHFDGVDAGFLQRVGAKIAAAEGPRLGLLTATGDKGEFFVVAASSSCACDLRELGTEVAELLEGRGGGSAELFQGKAGSFKNRDTAIRLLTSKTPLGGR